MNNPSSFDDVLMDQRGTARTESMQKSLAVARRAGESIGVTRVANVTGLDVVGIATWMAIRPTARTLSVSQGKGLSHEAAQVSALMEAIELHHAEMHVPMGIRATLRDAMNSPEQFANPLELPVARSAEFALDAEIQWVEAREIFTSRTLMVPRQMCMLDRTVPLNESSFFIASSNGLASGNTIEEALIHAICELIERDQVAFWLMRQLNSKVRSSTKLKLSSIDYCPALELIEKIQKCGMEIVVWYATTNISIPVFSCCIYDLNSNTPYPQRASGHGCHMDRGIALCRAITEAVQSRLTHISGSRDDMGWGRYQFDINAKTKDNSEWLRLIESEAAGFNYSEIEVEERCWTTGQALQLLEYRLTKSGLKKPIYIDLTAAELNVPVCYACVPGLEADAKGQNYTPGERMINLLSEGVTS